MKEEALTPPTTTAKLWKTLVRLEFYNSFSEKNTLILEGNSNSGNQAGLYFSVPVIKPWQGQICVCCYESSSLLPCQHSHLERNVQKLPQRSTALDPQQNSCIVNTRLDPQCNSWCQQQFCAHCGQYLAPKESFRCWGCIEINQHLMPHWRKTNEQGLWIQWVREMQLQPEKSQKNTN